MSRRAAAALLAALVCLTGLASPSASRADGDPASDYLVTVDYFTPTDPPPSTALRTDLDNLVFAAKRRGYVIKVALIGSRTDLGAVPRLFGKPGVYARFLGAELRFTYRGRLLIVMPQGFGTLHVPRSEADAVRGVRIGGTSSDDLVRAAMAAVRAGAAAGGVTLPVLEPTPVEPAPAPSPGVAVPAHAAGTSASLPVVPVAAGLVAVVLIGAVGLVAWRRPRLPMRARR